MFRTVLVANRGEIACRVIATLQRLGIRAVAVYTDADRDALHVARADSAVRIDSYLSIEAVVAAAQGADAIHPGYGFLSENADLARACEAAGVVFVGPGVKALEVMGDKIRAKEHVSAAGVPVIPGSSSIDAASADRVGYPLLVKPSAGGGGKGMTVVERAEDLADALVGARRVAAAAFGDDTLLLERLVRSPRHIEVQLLADGFEHVIHLGERECSLQRRHQKVIEEAPSPLLDEVTRQSIGEAACDVARSVGLRRRGDRRVPGVRRGADGVLLHGDEHAAAGGAPRHGAGHRAGPGRVAAAGRGGGAAHGAAVRRRPDRSRDRGARLRGGPLARLPAVRRHRARARRADRRRDPRRQRAAGGPGDRVGLRPDAGQGHRVGARPGDGDRAAGRGPVAHDDPRRPHQRRVPAPGAGRPRRPRRPARHRPARAADPDDGRTAPRPTSTSSRRRSARHDVARGCVGFRRLAPRRAPADPLRGRTSGLRARATP